MDATASSALDVVTEPEVVRSGGPGALDAAAAALASGRLVAFPTDTVYGLAADPRVEGATPAVFAAKRRSRELTLPVLVANLEQARAVASLDRRAVVLAQEYWPGPLTIVLRRTAASSSWDLGEQRASVGVRVPDHPLALELLERAGPLAVTSANISGEAPARDCEEVLRALADHLAVILCWGPAPQGRASTVVDLTGERTRVLREGEVSASEIEAALERAAEGLE